MGTKNEFNEYIEKYRKLNTNNKKDELLKQLKILAAVANEMCNSINVDNEMLTTEKLTKTDIDKEEDYLEALQVLITSTQNSLADFNNGLAEFFKEQAKYHK